MKWIGNVERILYVGSWKQKAQRKHFPVAYVIIPLLLLFLFWLGYQMGLRIEVLP